MRINRIIANHLGITRKQADELISRGKVKVNSNPAKPGQSVGVSDRIEIDNNGKKTTIKGDFPERVAVYKSRGFFVGKEYEDDKTKKHLNQKLPHFLQSYLPLSRMNVMEEGLLILRADLEKQEYSINSNQPDTQPLETYLIAFVEELHPEKKDSIIQIKGVTECKQYEVNGNDYGFLNLQIEWKWYIVTKTITRSPLFNLLINVESKPERMIKIADGEVKLNELYEQIQHDGFADVSE